ncbi:phage tail spike protein [Clostridium saudiense]|uniref:phage tail spike protein n=1 Tax=Clostridium saudiense TaxID=1414720 RepID=UPI0018A9A0AF
MYEVKLINDDKETIINAVSTHIDAPRITGTIKLGINTIDSFTFNIYKNNQGYDLIKSLKTKIEVINTKTNKVEFKGRVLLPKQKMSNLGLFTKTVVCESELGYLMDSTQRYGEYHNVTVREFLEIIIEQHNKQVSEDKQFKVGQVTVTDNNDSLYRFIGYEKTFNTIQDKLIDRLGGELRIRYINGVRYLDYLEEIGSVSTTEIRLAKNLVTLEEEKDPTSIITRLVPLGSKKTVIDDNGEETEIEERITVAEINNGLDYIDDIEAMGEFGIIEDTVTFDDVNIVENLLRKGQEYLKSNNKIRKSYSITALDLSLIGLDINSIDLYNYYKVSNSLMNIDEELRVIEKTIKIESPEDSTVQVGEKFDDIKKYQLSVSKTANEVKEVQNKLNNTIATVVKVENNVVQIGSSVGEIEDGLIGTNGNVTEIVNTLNILSNIVLSNTENITEVQGDIVIANEKIETVNQEIETIKLEIVDINSKLDEILSKLN